MNLYPLKFSPILKERLWGGTRLRDVLGKTIPHNNTGESWELSAVVGDISMVANGKLAGTSLKSLIESYPEQLLGKDVVKRFGLEFPILVKYLDAKLDLSVQLHPNDELARKRHNSHGKTEMWYIMEADPDASLIIGFNRAVSREQYQKSVEEGELLEILNYEKVKPGDSFFIDTGTIHAIGAGILLAEIQQTSDITYRVYDFNRRDKNGNLRELHTDMALDAIDFDKDNNFRISYSKVPNTPNAMVNSPYFTTGYLELDKPLERRVSGSGSFTIFLCVSGSAILYNEFGKVPVAIGETVLMPSSSTTIGIDTNAAKFLEVTV
jgi:mannose-6-phosphate isomerase